MTTDAARKLRRTILRVTELERRDTPAWWAVAAPAVPGGTHGSTDATTTGQLTLNPDYPVTNGHISVWADTAAHAAGLGLAGTMHSKYADHDRSHAFVQENIGDQASDHKSFLVVPNGSGGVNVLLEDMAGDPAADYDYNDQVWNGLPVPPTTNPVLFEGDFLWTGSSGDAKVHERVEALSPTVSKWDYFVHNISFQSSFSVGLGVGASGMGRVHLPSLSKEFVLDSYSSRGGQTFFSQETGPGVGEAMFLFGNSPEESLRPGQDAEFWLTTAPQPLQTRSGSGKDYMVMWHTSGPAVGPGEPVKADITIDGVYNAAAGVPEEFTEVTEDSIGGLVVRNIDGNDALRQKVTVRQIVDANNAPVPDVKVKVTGQGGLADLYDAVAGGNKVPTGTLLDNVNLPKSFWVQGVTGSSTMRDIKLKATPVLGNVALANGTDEVAFTVLWVDVVVATDGKVSVNNDKLQFKKSVSFDAAGKNTDALGINTMVSPGATVIGWSLEGRGLVHPADFSYPGSDLSLRRAWNRIGYFIPPVGKTVVNDTNGFKDDTSYPIWRDDNPLDSCGYIYDLDFPGFDIAGTNAAQGSVARSRMNFKEVAAITINGINTRASGEYAYYVRISFVQNGANVTDKWAVINPPDIVGDKKAFGPDQTSLNADLS